jgi:hypothetical protein
MAPAGPASIGGVKVAKEERPYGGGNGREAPADEFMTREQAIAYLGIEPRQFDALRAQFGIGRRYRTERVPGWYFLRSEMDEIKAGLKAQAETKAAG